MLTFLAILFILAVTALIGWQVSRSVPDEAELGGEYLHLGIDVLFLLLVSVTFYGFGMRFAALFVMVFIFARRIFPYLHGAVSGIALACATLAPNDIQIIIFLLALVLNFLIGVTTLKRDALIKRLWWQPAVALLVFFLLRFLPSKPF